MASINILVGTVTGGALVAANGIADVFKQQHEVKVYVNPSIENVTDEKADVLVIVTSSTGQGDLAATIVPLYRQLQDQLPLIPNKYFAVVALGDSSYDTFCQAGATMETLMFELQGKALCPRFNIDALEDYQPQRPAIHWAEETLGLIV
jgi:MioC protein